MNRTRVTTGALLLGAAAVTTAAGVAISHRTTAVVTIDGHRYTATVADDDRERAKGWQGIGHAEPGQAVLITWPAVQPAELWMADVAMPLTAIWIRDGRVVGTTTMPVCATSPGQCPRYASPGSVDQVLEVAQAPQAPVVGSEVFVTPNR